MTDEKQQITIRGARVHNLKNISLTIPHNKLVVVTGLSGSGKSTLAFDTIFAEGQRRYVESLSAYARQFLGRIEKPDVDLISGVSSPSVKAPLYVRYAYTGFRGDCNLQNAEGLPAYPFRSDSVDYSNVK